MKPNLWYIFGEAIGVMACVIGIIIAVTLAIVFSPVILLIDFLNGGKKNPD